MPTLTPEPVQLNDWLVPRLVTIRKQKAHGRFTCTECEQTWQGRAAALKAATEHASAYGHIVTGEWVQPFKLKPRSRRWRS